MIKISTFDEASKYLASFYTNARAVYSLDNMHQLMTELDNPQEKYHLVHVAGTSGKTSTSYYISAMLTEAGYKTGLTVSPHVDFMNERLQINGHPLPEAEYCVVLSEFLEIIEKSSVKPSWFELMVAMAYWYFAKTGMEYVVMEVGLGGLLDGTNVVTRADKVCVITDIGLDHTRVLGNTLGQIAEQKGGIIMPGNAVFVYEQQPEVMSAIRAAVKKAAGSTLNIIEPAMVDTASSLPVFQQRNSWLARRAVDFVLERDHSTKLSDDQLRQALGVYIPGRMETVIIGGKTLVIDGAHNAQKIEALLNSLHVKYPNKAMAVLVAFVEGDEKRLKSVLEAIGRYRKKLIVTSFDTSQDYHKISVPPDTVAELGRKLGLDMQTIPSTEEAFRSLMSQPEDLLVVTGSFYLLNHIRPLMLKA